ncbi:MAG: ABC transporter permease [Sulfolobales archaeon]
MSVGGTVAYVAGRFRTFSMIVKALISDKRGLAGLLIVLFYAMLGGVGPVLLTYDPILSQNLAEAVAMPEWLASPTTPRNINQTLYNWSLVSVEKLGDVSVSVSRVGSSFVVVVEGVGEANITLILSDYILYPYDPARSLRVATSYGVLNISDRNPAWYRIKYYLVNPDLLGRTVNLTIGGQIYTIPQGLYVFYDEPGFRIGILYSYVNTLRDNISVNIRLPNYIYNERQPTPVPQAVNPVNEMLLARDTRLTVGVNITYYCDPLSIMERCDKGGLRFEFRPVNIFIFGTAFGLLGTSGVGADVWTQFVYGARSAVIFGFSVAVAIVLLGLFIGVTAGYYGGKLRDYVLTYITDVVYFIPVLPLILAAGIVFGRSIIIIYLVIVLLSWPGTARVIRSWTLALRNELYVEAVQALGAGTGRILTKHIIPQLVPYLVYAVVVGVPGAVFTEVAIQLLGFGDPFWPSWGKMLNEAFYGGAINQGAWWWIMPPIAGVVTLALGFALMGLALDEIANPRLRRRI